MQGNQFTLLRIQTNQLTISPHISTLTRSAIAGSIQALRLPETLTVEAIAGCITAHPPIVHPDGDAFAAYRNLRSVELARLLPTGSYLDVIVGNVTPGPEIDAMAAMDAFQTAVVFSLDLHACPGVMLSLWQSLNKDLRSAISPNFRTKSALAAALNFNRRELSPTRVKVTSSYNR